MNEAVWVSSKAVLCGVTTLGRSYPQKYRVTDASGSPGMFCLLIWRLTAGTLSHRENPSSCVFLIWASVCILYPNQHFNVETFPPWNVSLCGAENSDRSGEWFKGVALIHALPHLGRCLTAEKNFFFLNVKTPSVEGLAFALRNVKFNGVRELGFWTWILAGSSPSGTRQGINKQITLSAMSPLLCTLILPFVQLLSPEGGLWVCGPPASIPPSLGSPDARFSAAAQHRISSWYKDTLSKWIFQLSPSKTVRV